MFSDRRIRTSLTAIAADLVLTLIKLLTAWITGSAALLADAYHSLTDILVSVTLLCGLVTRYCVEKGHLSIPEEKAHKLEAGLAVLMALLILYVPIEIIQEINAQKDEDLKHLWVGILGILLCIFIAWFMSRLKHWVGKETDSMALVADGYHSQLDVFSSIAVLLSLIGTMIGIYLDEIVAVIIAVMVGIAGLELLVSGLKSLFTGHELEQISIIDKLKESSLGNHTQGLLRQIKKLRQPKNALLTIALATCTYALSGFKVIPHGHVGYSQFLYHRDNSPLESGLYYVAPWPIGGMITLPKTHFSRINTEEARQASTDTNHEEENGISGLWKTNFSNQATLAPGNQLFLTFDENMADIDVSVHYVITPEDQLRISLQTQQALIFQFAESALVYLAAEKEYLHLLHGSKKELETRLNQLIKSNMERAGINLSYIQTYIQSVKSPAPVVESHWQQFNEYQNLQKAKLNADSKRQEDLAAANAESLSKLNIARSIKTEQVEFAQGDLNRYKPLQALYQDHSDILKYNAHDNQMHTQLSNKSITIVDPDLSHEQLRLWHPATIQKQ